MSLTANEVNKIAHLARLGIDGQDIDAYTQDLSGMLALMAEIGDIDTTEIEPMAHPLDQKQRLRPDRITETNQREIFQAIAPQVEQGLYLVPKVIE
jgi:aspartyl-tRNA(Asn)/glutamyl-tRNA(Gln) amidotransferase subunit C